MPTKNQQKILSQIWEERKMAENGRPKIGKTEKQRKTAFPNLGRTKNSEKQLSQTWEERKTVKNSCPKLGKNEKHCRQSFPPLGNRKMLKINSSLVSEMQKTRKNRLLRKKLTPESLLSDFRGSVLF